MDEKQALTDRVLDQVVELTRDHQQDLAELAARIGPMSGDLAQAWAKVYRESKVRQPLPPEPMVRAIQEEAVRRFFGGLCGGDLREYYASFLVWGRELASSGLLYDQVLVLLREYRRSGLPFLLKAYPLGADLQLALAALDDLFAGMVMVMGAAYVEAAQEQLMCGARVRTVGQLAGGAAHTLNNLLTAIVGHAQLLQHQAQDAESRRELQEIQRSASAGAQVVRRLQDFTSTRPEDKLVETDLNSLLKEAAEITRSLWRDQSEASGIIIDVVKDLGDVPVIMARPSEMRELVVALLLNAIEAMPRGGLITLRSERRGDNIVISVIDTGEGMSEATRLRVFDPFFTTKGPEHVGLGLSNATTIAERHMATLTVRSELGRGSAFTLAIPVARETEFKTPAAGPAGAAVSVPAAKTGPYILVIDDEKPVRDVAVKFLTFRGYSVNVADSGPEGIAAFKKRPYDLVLSDLGMPGMSGWDVAREIKRLNPRSLVVLMTGWATELDQQKVKESGVDRVVHKPFDIEEIGALIDEAQGVREKM